MMNEDLTEILSRIGTITAASPEAVREHAWKTSIEPKLLNAGFHHRHVQNLHLGKEQAAVLNRLQNRLTGIGAIIALVGPRGVGKTTLAGILAREWAWADYKSIFDKADGKCRTVKNRYVILKKMTSIVAKLKAFYGDFGTIEISKLEQFRQFLVTCDLLVVDELHEVDEDSRHKARTLTDILDCRYAAQRDSILISNETEKEFRQNISTSIMSRLSEHGAIISCNWPSYRVKSDAA